MSINNSLTTRSDNLDRGGDFENSSVLVHAVKAKFSIIEFWHRRFSIIHRIHTILLRQRRGVEAFSTYIKFTTTNIWIYNVCDALSNRDNIFVHPQAKGIGCIEFVMALSKYLVRSTQAMVLTIINKRVYTVCDNVLYKPYKTGNSWWSE